MPCSQVGDGLRSWRSPPWSPWPPVMLSVWRAVQMRGPGTSPSLIARLQRDVRAAVRADVADRGEPGLERAPRVDRRPHGGIDRAQRHRADDRVRGAFAGDVRVGVDQARHHGGARQVDDLGSGGLDETGLDVRDAVAVDEDRHLLADDRGRPVDQPSGMDDLRLGGRAACRTERLRGRRRKPR